MKDERKGILAAIIVGLIFGTSGILIRWIADVSEVAITFSRILIGFIAIAFFLLLSKEQIKVPDARDYKHFIFLGISVGVGYLFVTFAMKKTLIANASVLLNTSPIIVLLLAPLILKERISIKQAASILLVFIGASIIVGIDKLSLNPQFIEGDLFALGDAFMYALYTVYSRKLSKKYSFGAITFWSFGIGALIALFNMFLFGGFTTTVPQASSIVYLIILGVAISGVAVALYNISLEYLKAQITSTIVLLDPVSATFYGMIIFNEFPSTISIFGILLVLLGLVFTIYLNSE